MRRWYPRMRNHATPRGHLRGSSGLPAQDIVSPVVQLGPQFGEGGVIGLAPSPHQQVPRGKQGLEVAPEEFADPPAELIAVHSGFPVLRYDHPEAWVPDGIRGPQDVQVWGPAPTSLLEQSANQSAPGEPTGPREPLRWRQDPPCLFGIRTVRTRRPFLRRRLRTARPQRSAIRARNPCLLTRRLLRGRYDGFMFGFLPFRKGAKVPERRPPGQG